MIGLLIRARERAYVAIYSVYEPPEPAADRIDRAEAMVFLKDGFSWGATLLAPLWLAGGGMWAGLAAYATAVVLVAAGLVALGAADAWIVLALVALHVIVGFEATALQRWALERRGWTEAGTVSGNTQAECERRFFDMWLAGTPMLALGGPGAADGARVSPARGPWFRRLLGRRHAAF